MNTAPTNHEIHSLLSQRFSPYAFDAKREVAATDIYALFEAARWAPSAYNDQPWRFVLGVRANDDGLWQQILDLLVEANQNWARNAPVLALGIREKRFEFNGEENHTALYDLGAAAAYLTFEASARGLAVHQMGGLRHADAHKHFALAPTQEVHTAMAIGYAATADQADPELWKRQSNARTRKPLSEILLHSSLPTLTEQAA